MNNNERGKKVREYCADNRVKATNTEYASIKRTLDRFQLKKIFGYTSVCLSQLCFVDFMVFAALSSEKVADL